MAHNVDYGPVNPPSLAGRALRTREGGANHDVTYGLKSSGLWAGHGSIEEELILKPKFSGSMPVSRSTQTISILDQSFQDITSTGRAPALQVGGSGFDPRRLHQTEIELEKSS